MGITEALKTDISLRGDMAATQSGDLATVSGLPNLLSALFHRLVTIPGSLAHRPAYGVGVGRFQNGLSSFVKQQKLASIIIEQFKLDPRVQTVKSVSVFNDDNPDMTKIQVSVVPVGYDEQVVTYTPFNNGLVK